MKKTVAMLVMLAAAMLCAGEAENVKAVVVKDWQLAAQGKFAESLALRTPDFVEIDETGTFTYEQSRWLSLALDGEHPEEFLLTLLAGKSHGAFKAPTAEQMARIREEARKPEFLQGYKRLVPQLLASLKADQELQLKTLKFVSITVDGDAATAVIEYDSDTSGSVEHRIYTVTLRKVDGNWKICKGVVKYKE